MNISVDIDATIAAMRRLSQAPEQLPTQASMEVSHGVSIGPTTEFRAALDAAATNLGIRVAKIRTLLADSHEQIAQTLQEFAAKDEVLSSDVALIMEMVNSAEAPTTETGTAQDQQHSGGLA